MAPSTFSTAPSTLSLIAAVVEPAVAVFFLAGARFLPTPAPVVVVPAAFFAAGLRFLVPVVVDVGVLRLRTGSVETGAKTRGLEWPVAPRV